MTHTELSIRLDYLLTLQEQCESTMYGLLEQNKWPVLAEYCADAETRQTEIGTLHDQLNVLEEITT